MTTSSQLVFDPYSEQFYADPHGIYRRLRAEAPVYHHEDLDFYALTRHEDVAAAYRDFRTFSSTAGLDLAMMKRGDPPPKTILYMDPPEHGRMRGLVTKAFTARAIAAQRETVTDLVQRCLAVVDPGRFDVVQEFAAIFPAEIIGALVGVPEDRRQQFREWVDEGFRYEPGQIEPSEMTLEVLLKIAAYCYELVRQRHAQPQDDMLSALIAAEMQRGDRETARLSDDEIVFFAMVLTGAGSETVTKLIANAVAAFAKHPDQWRKLLDDRSKVPAAVEEVMRYDSPVLYNIRKTVKEVTLHGVTIPAGKPVLLCGLSANRDPDAFTDPDTFDIERDHTEAPQLALGYGPHTCLGAALARMETAIALEHLLDFMPEFQVDWDNSERVNTPTVAGWLHLPVTVLR
ncbi:cytochrome P450 [Mycobacterium deserti]|uniref:Cytochrome P450 n=1 Tax=Mycobacterium deserti TaxID=2978347 RepID=A0ABT2MAG6_9MYCO|nr:cytochrome P450 [Mycobacterium deserti]MCT7659255.1 cytochrome P450 [Mycobacterium deserti]